jgi:biopolymer transport protein ExbD
MKFKYHLKIEDRFDLTPLIDVVLLLNIFFMLSSSFIFPTGIKVNLADSSVSETKKEIHAEVIITRNDLFFWNGTQLSSADLSQKLRETGRDFPESLLIISADESSHHRSVVQVISLAKMNGLKKIVLATKPVKVP